MNKDSFDKALMQVAEVKELCHQREKMGVYQCDPYVDNKNKPLNPKEDMLDYRNPIFTMIFSRFSVDFQTDKRTKDPDKINYLLIDKLYSIDKSPFLPELIVAGNSNIACCCYTDQSGIKRPSRFYLPDNKTRSYLIYQKEKLAFGMALAYLMAGLDFINLYKMPWEDIINDIKNNN